MATLEIKGLDRLIKKIDDLGGVGDKVKKQLIYEGANVVLDRMKADAPKGKRGSYKHLKIVDSRSGKDFLYLDVGINHENWKQCRGLYFQNYDGERSSGRHVQWMNRSFAKSKVQARKIIRDGLIREVKL